MDFASILSMMQAMGLPEEMRKGFSSDPASFLKEAMAFNAGQTFPGADAALKSSVTDSTSDFIEQIKQAKANFARERSLPPKKVAPMRKEDLSFLLNEFETNESERCSIMMRQTFVGTLSHHSSKSLEDLAETNISKLYARKTHKGTFLPCRIISKTRRVVGTDFVVEDSDREVAHVSVYKYPFTLDATNEETNAIFRVGARIAIREPTYKITAYGSDPMIRVDSPTDIVFLDDIPLEMKSRNTVGLSPGSPVQAPTRCVEDWKADGSQAFKKGQWLLAAITFSEGLKLDPHHHVLTLNRVEAYLRIGWLHSALSEAQRALSFESLGAELRVKAIGRAARACYGMGRYDDAIVFTEMLPGNADLAKIARDCRDRMRERMTGEYNWLKLTRLSRKKPCRPDIADYIGPIEVRPSQKLAGHRGVFVSRDVRAGELLVVSRPIASNFVEDNTTPQMFHALNFLTNRVNDYCSYSLICRCVTRLWDDPELAKIFQSMYAGPDLPFNESATSTEPIAPRPITHPRCPSVDIDVARVESVCSYNAFSLDSFEEALGAVKFEKHKDRSNALYEYPSYCNHSCLPSALRTFFGDVMVIRACRDMKAGEEVTTQYFVDRETMSKEGEKSAEEIQWGFKCSCESCAAEAADGREALAKRSQLVALLKANPPKSKAKSLLLLIENSYKAAHWANIPVRKELAVAYRTMGFVVYSEAHAKDATQIRTSIEYLVKFMGAEGVIVRVPKSPGGRGRKGSKTDIKIEVKGHPSHGFHAMVRTLIKIAHLLRLLIDKQDYMWFKAAVMLSDLHFGGGKDCFVEVYKSDLEMMDCMHFLKMV